MKVCSSCGSSKPLSEFYKWKLGKDGYRASCKSCTNKQNKSSSAKNPEAALRAKRKYKKVNVESVRAQTQNYRDSNPIKREAHVAVQLALRNGTLGRKDCECCGATSGVVAHHDDYSKPLDVRWLCNLHHKQWHNANGEGLNGK